MVSTGGFNRRTNMGPAGGEANDPCEEETPLICGLPDDIAIYCLARVPRTYHAKLKCVSKRWRKLVCGEEWRIVRKRYNLDETWIYALCENGLGKDGIPKYCCYVLDPYAPRKYWKRIRDIPPCIVQRQYMKFEVLGTKAYLIGGRDFTESEWEAHDRDDDTIPNVADEVYCYDAITNSWSKVAPLSTPRCHFGSEVLDGKIYAVGTELNPDGKCTWEAYDPATNTWTSKSDPHVMDTSVESVVYNGKLYVRNGACGVVYDPSTGMWRDADNDLVSDWTGTSVVADKRLFAFAFDTMWCPLMMWDEGRKKWVVSTHMSQYLWTPDILDEEDYRLVAIGKCIFFIGDELFIGVLDVSDAGKGGKLSFSKIPVYGIRPDICKCMAI